MLIILRPWSTGDTRTSLAVGALLALALLIKPAVFALTILLFGAAFALASGPLFDRRHSRRMLLRAYAMSIGTAALLAAPHYLVAIDRVIAYFVANFFGQNSQIWQLKLPAWDHALFYLVGPGGQFSLGYWLHFALAAAIGWAALISWRRDSRALWQYARVLAVTLLCYAAVSATSYKSIFIGIALSSLMMVAVAIAAVAGLRSLVASGRTVLASVVTFAIVAFSAFEFTTPWARSGRAPVSLAEGANKHRMVREIVDALQEQSLEGAALLEPVIAQYVNSSTLTFAMLQRRLEPITAIGFGFFANPDIYRNALPLADAAIAFSPDADVIRWIPGNRLRQPVLADLSADPDWILVRTIEDRTRAGPVFLYRRRPLLGEMLEARGFGPIEGPYPHWNLPKVRWGSGRQNTLASTAAPNSRADLVFEVRAPVEGQTVTVIVDGRTVGAFAAPTGARFVRHEVAFAHSTSGKAAITLAYAQEAPRTVLFRRLQIVPARPD
jgi:hypothetical protein